jgi:hypothetical protein
MVPPGTTRQLVSGKASIARGHAVARVLKAQVELKGVNPELWVLIPVDPAACGSAPLPSEASGQLHRDHPGRRGTRQVPRRPFFSL